MLANHLVVLSPGLMVISKRDFSFFLLYLLDLDFWKTKKKKVKKNKNGNETRESFMEEDSE